MTMAFTRLGASAEKGTEMRFIGTFSLAAIAMALIGATSASAANTQLCNTHTALTCGSAAAVVSMKNEGVGTLLSNLASILCLNIETTASPLALANPQSVHVLSLVFTECGTKASHENCEIETLTLPLANLNKTGLDTGTITGTYGEILVACEDIDIFGTDIECTYDATDLQFYVGAQHLTASETPVEEIGSDFLCPNNPTLDGLLVMAEGESPPATVLCKTHAKPCGSQVESIDMTTTKAPVLYNSAAIIECESSLAAATVLNPAEPQRLDVTTLSWKECHTLGPADNCTVTTNGLPTIDLEATALNLGSATTSGFEIEVDCLILDLIELDCTYDSDMTLQVEGALHKEGSGHGKFSAVKTTLELAEGGEHCPEEMKWDASYEASAHLYVVTSSSEKSGSKAYILQ